MMNATTGRSMDEVAHIQQSIGDIVGTRIGTRIKRRDYGSLVPDLIDHPGNATNQLRLMAAIAMAIARWEPRVLLTKVNITQSMDGKTVIDLDGIRRNGPRSGQSLSLSVGM